MGFLQLFRGSPAVTGEGTAPPAAGSGISAQGERDASLLTKEDLEKRKLAFEISELDFKIKSGVETQGLERRSASRNHLLSWIGFGTAAIGLLAGGWSLFSDTSKYFKDRERDVEVRLTKEMVDLVGKLTARPQDDKARDDAEGAALLLSSYEKAALPILLWNLERVVDPSATVRALTLVGKKSNVGEAVMLDSVLDGAEAAFKRPEATKDWNPAVVRAVHNYTITLGNLFKAQPKKALEVLNRWEKRLNDKALRIGDVPREGLAKDVAEAKAALSASTGPPKP